jgi:hypothetical protein
MTEPARMSREEVAAEMLRRCEEGAFQKDAAEAVAEIAGYSATTCLLIYTQEVPKEQRPINGGTGVARRKRELEKRTRLEAIEVTTRCAGAGCTWKFDGTVKDGREAYARHRETCTAERPTIREHPKGTLERDRSVFRIPDAEAAPAPA